MFPNQIGTFEIGGMTHCNDCCTEIFCPWGSEFVADPQSVFETGEFNLDDPSWACPSCNSIHPEMPDLTPNLAVRFECPCCKMINVQVIEPSWIEKEAGNIRQYSTNSIICVMCEEEFGMLMMNGGESLHAILTKIDNDHV